MDDQSGCRSAPRRLLKLVCPPAVIRQRLALEKIAIIRAGLVHEEQRHFPVKVDVLVIVPVVLGRLDSIAHKHDGRIDVRHLRLALVVGYEIDQVLGLEGFSAGLRELEGGFRKRLHAHHRHGLEKSSVVPRRLQPIRRKLFPDVIRRRVAAALPRPAPFQFITRKIFHMRANFFLVHLRQWRLSRRRLVRPRSRHLPLPCRAILSCEDARESKQGARKNHRSFLHENSSITEGIIS